MDKQRIIEAYCRIREIDSSIPDDVLDYMNEASLQYESLLNEIDSLKAELADAIDASESYKEQLQNTYLNDTQHVNREFMG